MFEVKADRIVRRGKIETSWNPENQTLSNTYHNEDFERAVTIRSRHATALYSNGRLSYDIELEPGKSWHCCLLYDLRDCGNTISAPPECVAHDAESRHGETLRDWQSRVLTISTSNEEYYRFFRQAVDDASLRLERDRDKLMIFILAAGLPWFMALFGRDTLIVSLQSIYLSGICARHVGNTWRSAGDRARRLSRC